jgi:hypothetical protein
VLPERIELSTSPLPRECSTIEYNRQIDAMLRLEVEPAVDVLSAIYVLKTQAGGGEGGYGRPRVRSGCLDPHSQVARASRFFRVFRLGRAGRGGRGRAKDIPAGDLIRIIRFFRYSESAYILRIFLKAREKYRLKQDQTLSHNP